jgi:hypothetical protein
MLKMPQLQIMQWNERNQLLPPTAADGVASELGDVHRPRGRRSSSG